MPHGEAVEYSSQPSADAIEIYVYAGADGDFTLYEDDGLSYDYEKGACSRIALHWDDAARRLEIGAREGGFEGMPESRSLSVRLHTPEGVLLSEAVTWNGEAASISFDAHGEIAVR